MTVLVGVIMGSDSDLSVMQGAVDVLTDFGVATRCASSPGHRTPDVTSTPTAPTVAA
jgi:5-(carboxyamino)imidazole ribonucleotide mutase